MTRTTPPDPDAPRTHLAVLKKRYLEALLTGDKTIEARLSKHRVAPYRAVAPGDAVYLKQSAGPVRAVASVLRVRFFDDLHPATVRALCAEFNGRILGTADYWKTKADARYASLLWLSPPRPLRPLEIPAVPALFGAAWVPLPGPRPHSKRSA